MRDESTLPTVLRKVLPPNLEKIKQGHYTRDHPDYSVHLYLEENDIRIDENGSEIVKFLRGQNILITGATGFLGKLLVEKLLRCCKDIGNIYIIVRDKRGKDLQTRVDEYLDNWVFHRLSEIHPNYKEKVIGIGGDFELDGLGLSAESRKILKEKVNIIYHVAATVRFDEKLKRAVKINIRGTQEMLRLAKECKKLQVFVHVSTAFSNCHEKSIGEKFYPPHLDPYKMMKLAEELPDDTLEKIAPALVDPVPNTYAFTKQITEDIVKQEAIGIPACIHRPSIVIACAKEPIKSWVDNIFGPAGLIQGASVGLVHVMFGNRNGRCDMVPADFVINSCIASSYKTAKERQLDQVPIFNYTTSKENPLYWKGLAMSREQGVKIGSTKMIYKEFCAYTTCYYWYLFLNFLVHTIPGYIGDFVAVQLGHKPLLRAAYKKINKFITVLSHFTLNEWSFDNSNTKKLWEELNEADRKAFPFDMASLNWQNYFDTYLVALREFLLLESLDNLDKGRVHFWRLNIIHYIVMTLLIGLTVYFLLNTIFFFVPACLIAVIIFYKLVG